MIGEADEENRSVEPLARKLIEPGQLPSTARDEQRASLTSTPAEDRATPETPLARPPVDRPATISVGRGDAAPPLSPGDGDVPVRPAVIEASPQPMPSPGPAAIVARWMSATREPERSAPLAPVDVHIETIEIVTDGPAPTDAPTPTAGFTGFADYDAIRAYDWGD